MWEASLLAMETKHREQARFPRETLFVGRGIRVVPEFAGRVAPHGGDPVARVSSIMKPHLILPGRLAVLIATSLLLAGCPERPINRGTDVPETAGERFTKDVDGKDNPSGEDKASAATQSDKQARETDGSSPAPSETTQ